VKKQYVRLLFHCNMVLEGIDLDLTTRKAGRKMNDNRLTSENSTMELTDDQKDLDGPAFLINVSGEINAEMLEEILQNANIPVMRKYPGSGQYMQLVMGASICGVDLYVPAEQLEEANKLIDGIGTAEDSTASGDMNAAGVVIRPMYISDYESLAELWSSTPGVGLRLLDDSEVGIEKYLERNPSTCFVAEDETRIVGSILAGHDGRRGYIYHTVVASDYRGKNIGKALVDSAVDALVQEGIHKVALVVFKDNAIGNPFWTALGWECREDLNYYNLTLNTENL
jgi:ribosomal protein S18 acetylase RimI-like enzyme